MAAVAGGRRRLPARAAAGPGLSIVPRSRVRSDAGHELIALGAAVVACEDEGADAVVTGEHAVAVIAGRHEAAEVAVGVGRHLADALAPVVLQALEVHVVGRVGHGLLQAYKHAASLARIRA